MSLEKMDAAMQEEMPRCEREGTPRPESTSVRAHVPAAMIGLTLGQQSWLRLLNIEQPQVMAGTSASMAPGFEDADKLAATKASGEYWAKSKAATPSKVA